MCFFVSTYLTIVHFLYILLFSLHFCQPYLHNIIYTKNACFHIYISNSYVYQKLSMSFFLLNIPLSLLHYTLVVFLQAYVRDPDNILPQLFLSLFYRITPLTSFRHHFLFFHILFVFDILVQILNDTCIPMLYVINYSYPFGYTSLYFDSVCRPTSFYQK